MTEAFNPNALVGTQDLLSLRPKEIVQRHEPEVAAVAFASLARGLMNRPAENIPLGKLQHDPANHWGLTPEERGAAYRATDDYIAETRFVAETETLAADAFPGDEASQLMATRNAQRILHHVALDTILLPRRQAYQEFAKKRYEWLERILGNVATTELLQGGDPQVSYVTHKNLEEVIGGAKPVAELPDLSALGPTATRSILQEMIGDAAVLARLLLRYAPERLTEQTVWPTGPADLAQSVLRRDPLDLRQALLDAPDTPAREIIAIYLRDPLRFDEFIVDVTHRRRPLTLKESRVRDEQETRNVQRLLHEQLDRADVKPEVLTAPVGEVIELTPKNEILSQRTLSVVLNANLDALGFSQFLDSVAEREAERTGMPELSKTWQDNAANPTNKLLGDYYGRVDNLRIVKLPVDESALGERGATAEEIDLRRVVRMRVTADLCSSAGSPITRTVEVLIYPRRRGARGRSHDLITCETRDLDDRELSGANDVVRLWEASAARAIALAEEASSDILDVGTSDYDD